MTKEDILEFIEKHEPCFLKESSKGFNMFTVLTQRIKGETPEALLQRGVDMMRNGAEVLKYPTWKELLENLVNEFGSLDKIPDNIWCQYRISDIGTVPHSLPGSEVKGMVAWSVAMGKIMDAEIAKILWAYPGSTIVG